MKFIALAVISASAFAGETKLVIEPQRTPERSFYALGEATAIGKVDYTGGSGSMWEGRFQLGVIQPLSGIRFLADKGGQWQLRLGLDHLRHEFDHTNSFPLPSRLQRVAGVVALEYRVGKQVGVLVEARPGVYFENDIRSNTWNCPVIFGMGIPLTDSFTLAVGGRFDANRELPIIGGLGFVWKINDRLTLLAIPPEPTLTWAANENLDLWLRGEWAGGAYRTDARNDSLGNAIVTYSDTRASIGATWQRNGWKLEAGAGLSFDREWDFHKNDRSFSSDEAAPFVKLAMRSDW